MAKPNLWLRPSDFEGRIQLPQNFKLSVFFPALTDLEEIALPELLGSDRLAALLLWLTENPYGVRSDETAPINTLMVTLYGLIVPFLVYSAYAEYVMTGDVQPTDTGLVTKDRTESEAIGDTTRMQLYRTYRDKANIRATRLSAYVAKLQTPASCTPNYLIPELRISSSRGRTKSITDNL